MKEKVNDALKQHFRPEFLNRIDDVIVFHELSPDEVTQIVDLMIRRVAHAAREPGPRPRAHPRPPSCSWPSRGYDPTLGARPLRRAIQRLVEDPLSRAASSTRSSGPARSSSSTPRTTPRRPASSRSCSGRWRASSPRRWSWPRPARRLTVGGRRDNTGTTGVLRGAFVAFGLVLLLAGCRLDVDVTVVDAEADGAA